jgi:hypothetical protein
MSALSNGDRQSIFYTIGCWACDYPLDTCIGEAFVRNTGGGGVAFIGNSRYGWYSPYNDNLYSLRFDRYFFRWLFWRNAYTLGDCFSAHKNDAISLNGGTTYQYIYTELTLLGDPELPIWTEDPQSLAVTHADSLTAGESTTFPVEVFSGGSPVVDATVCLWKGADIYQIEQTGGSGVASFVFSANTTGDMHVTATSHNYLPYEGQAEVMPRGDGRFDGDEDVDLVDFAAFQACFGDLGVGDCGPGNMTGSGFIQADDFALFAGELDGPA